MSEQRTVFRPEVQAEPHKIPRDMALHILTRPTELESDPLGFNTTTLVSQPERRRLRVGDHHIVHTIDDGVRVVHLGHRSTSMTPATAPGAHAVGQNPP
ncbi:type II toxin-antitoxin system RelE/ParE family toxin [Streptomyces sp. NPDC020766]|uniref:type II toxin-antitoxin system RelE family toxin n=1 Tax=Streptomyces sp. NPDC020766 TaxID=3155011 RepID=UPI0034074021